MSSGILSGVLHVLIADPFNLSLAQVILVWLAAVVLPELEALKAV